MKIKKESDGQQPMALPCASRFVGVGDRGVGQKSESPLPPAPPSVSRADFFSTEQNFDLFGHPVGPDRAVVSRAERPPSRKTPALAKAVARLAAEGLTRREIAARLKVGESTLYQNYFLEIGGRAGCPGRRLHIPSIAQRTLVARRSAEGASAQTIAAELRLSAPTLRKHYCAELRHTPSSGDDYA